MTTAEVFQTSRAAGPGGMPDHLADEGALTVDSAPPAGVTTINVDNTARQTILGFGAALAESVASVVTALPAAQQTEIMDAFFGPTGSGYTLVRTHIGSCDFAATLYSFDESCGSEQLITPCTTPDTTLSKFSIAHDTTVQAGVMGSGVLVPFLKSAIATAGGNLKVLASPWSAPGWMKTNGVMKGDGSDGSLLPQYYAAYASYLSKYIQAYTAAGVPIWGITPQNEALGVGGGREGMQWTPQQMDTFIGTNLGPQLKADGVDSTKVFIYDHNKGPVGSDVQVWAQTMYKDAKASPFITGTAVHWYGNTFNTYNDTMDAVHGVDTTKDLIFDEGTADELGDIGFGKSSAAFNYSWMKDDYYWTKDSRDWGYWFSDMADHPIYEPEYRYIRDLINGLNHWYMAFYDWVAVLNKDGGPGHIYNPIPASIMVDTTANTLYYSPTFYVMRAFAKYIRPQAQVLTTTVNVAAGVTATDYDGMPTQDGDSIIATAALNTDGSKVVQVFNETKNPIPYAIVFGATSVHTTIPAQTLQTVVLK